jgi:GNAT superfamily N-acetyltransferase
MSVCVEHARTDEEILACYPVMHELRPHIVEGAFVARVRRQAHSGYRLVFAKAHQRPIAVAGFRLGENLAWGRFLYVDDLVTLPSYRSHGIGAALLSWLKAYARSQGCRQLHLDSGLDRVRAHRFYVREGMTKTGLHFVANLQGGLGQNERHGQEDLFRVRRF